LCWSHSEARARYSAKYGPSPAIHETIMLPWLCETLGLKPAELLDLDEETVTLWLAYKDGAELGRWAAQERALAERGK